MRISQIMLARGFGGAERSFVDTALALAERGHQVQAICHEQFSKLCLLQGVEGLQLKTVNARGEWDFVTPRRIAKYMQAFQTEIVHTQLKRAAWHGGRAGKIAGVPVVAKLHNYVDLARYKHVQTLFCTTQDQRRHVLEAGWPEKRVEVVPNFSRLRPVEAPRSSMGQPLHILSYGRYVKKKGFDVLLRAFKTVRDAGADARLTIGGQGEELAALRQLSDELGISEFVELGVWLDDVSAALDGADVFALPSFDEPFGIVMLEAMARGVPIVSTKTKGPVEVLTSGTAYLVDIGSIEELAGGILACAHEPEQAIARADKALNSYRDQYFEDSVIPRIEGIYQRVISDS